MSTSDGGPAFPQPIVQTPGGSGIVSANELKAGGMSLRDWFAGMALQGWLSTYPDDYEHPARRGREHILAIDAYAMADAMLAERERKQ